VFIKDSRLVEALANMEVGRSSVETGKIESNY